MTDPGGLDSFLCLRIATVLAALGSLLGALDLLYNRDMLRPEGTSAWSIAPPRWAILRNLAIFRDPYFNGVVVVRAAAALAMLVCASRAELRMPWPAIAAGGLFLTQLLFNVRLHPDGAGNMETLNWAALSLGWLVPDDEIVRAAALCFIAVESCLCYAANGWVKVTHDQWRSGDVVWRLVDHPLYGSPLLASAARSQPRVGRLVLAGTAWIELLFPLVLFVGLPWAWLFIAWGVLFHTANAVFMGLYHFWYQFVATYPAILFCAVLIQRADWF